MLPTAEDCGNAIDDDCDGSIDLPPAIDGGAGANDSAGVRVSIRTPTNASGFELRFRLLSAEYASRACSSFNDFFLARLDTAAPGMTLDKNAAFDAMGNAVSVNNVFFDVCEPQGSP